MEYSTQSAYRLVPLSLPRKEQSKIDCSAGADYSVNIKDKTNEHVSHEIKELNILVELKSFWTLSA